MKGETAVRTATGLVRLRQLDGELNLVAEALDTFSRIGRQLRSRPRLAPEQEVARSIFELAEADYALKKASLSAERLGLLRGLELSIGSRLPSNAMALPPARERWPDIPKAEDGVAPELVQARAHVEAAQAGLRSERAAAWPDLRVGPSFQRQSAEGSTQNMLGFNAALPLPLYHRNAGGKERARHAVEGAQRTAAAAEARLRAEREVEAARYAAAVEALAFVAGRKEVGAKHERIEDFFQRGLISSSLVIEAHRQIFEFTRGRNEHELAATRALWRIRAIDGRITGETL